MSKEYVSSVDLNAVLELQQVLTHRSVNENNLLYYIHALSVDSVLSPRMWLYVPLQLLFCQAITDDCLARIREGISLYNAIRIITYSVNNTSLTLYPDNT